VATTAELVAWAVGAGIVAHGGLVPAPRHGSRGEAKDIPDGTKSIMCKNPEVSAHAPQHLLVNDGADGPASDGSSRRSGAGQRSRQRGRPTVMTASRLAQARELLGSHTITDIATKLGVSRRTLYAHMRRIRPSAQAH
jgi:DNA-binding CsgD family transcriptional regulator